MLNHPQISLHCLNAPHAAANGVIPLSMAAWLNFPDLVQLLLEESADTVAVDALDAHGATALMCMYNLFLKPRVGYSIYPHKQRLCDNCGGGALIYSINLFISLSSDLMEDTTPSPLWQSSANNQQSFLSLDAARDNSLKVIQLLVSLIPTAVSAGNNNNNLILVNTSSSLMVQDPTFGTVISAHQFSTQSLTLESYGSVRVSSAATAGAKVR